MANNTLTALQHLGSARKQPVAILRPTTSPGPPNALLPPITRNATSAPSWRPEMCNPPFMPAPLPLHRKQSLKKREPSLLEETAQKLDLAGNVRQLTLGLSKDMQAGVLSQSARPCDVHQLRVGYKSGLMPKQYPLYEGGLSLDREGGLPLVRAPGRRQTLPALKGSMDMNALANGRQILGELSSQRPMRPVICS